MSAQKVIIRYPVSERMIDEVLKELRTQLNRRLEKHGNLSYIGKHEIYGMLAEEFNKELLDDLHANNEEGFVSELFDIAVGCVFGVASMMEISEQLELKM